MAKIGIVIDKWKRKIFSDQLRNAGYDFKVNRGITEETLLLKVDTIDVERLQHTVKRANDACARSRMH